MGDKPNRLIHEKSPYLLQHAFNPVDWYPWGEEAFALAKAEEKPIFLSVGYSTCHWCHVMEEESFENEEIAAILNRWFISIKVDREERPDIDQMYMAATQAMTGSGGWPMSVFLLPDCNPFYAGTYFPPQSIYGRPGFADLLHGIHEVWETKRLDIENVSSQLLSALKKNSRQSEGTKIPENILDKAYSEFTETFDKNNGGFGTAPKFPRPVQFNFLLRYWHRTGKENAGDMVLQTLQHMERGGIWDQVGGGFHRYATDRQWRVPHFEKMLYDQGQLANTYLDAYQITGEKRYADVAAAIFEYVLRDMTSQGGGFYSAEDADSVDPYHPGRKSEGAFYLWTEKEIREILTGIDADIFVYRFGIKPDGNAPEDPLGEFKGRNIPYQARSIGETAGKYSRSEKDVVTSLGNSTRTLLAVRNRRTRPHLDDKILVAWNGLMIQALARGGVILNDSHLLASAVKAASFIHEKMYEHGNGKLHRRFRDGEAGLDGQLDDYGFLVSGLFSLYQAEQDPQWLKWALALTAKQIELFWDSDHCGFFDSVGDETLPFRMKGNYDGAEAAGNSIAAANLLRLGSVIMNPDWLEKGALCSEIFSSQMTDQPTVLPEMLNTWRLAQSKPLQIIICGPRNRKDTRRMLKTAHRMYAPDKIVLRADNDENEQYLADQLPYITDLEMVNDQATAYVCKDFACQLPVTKADDLTKTLAPKVFKTPMK